MGANHIFNPKIQNQDLIQGPREFLINIKKELARVQRYGHKSTFLLVKPLLKSNGSKEDYLKFLCRAISNELRNCDSVYLFDSDCIAAILPNTHEAGGETAAHRVKKKISQIGLEGENRPVPMSVGVVSVWPGDSLSEGDLIQELRADLERDNRCQLLLHSKGEEITGPKLCLLTGNDLASNIYGRLSRTFRISQDQADLLASDLVIVEKGHQGHRRVEQIYDQINSRLTNKLDLKYEEKELTFYFSERIDLESVIASIVYTLKGIREPSRTALDKKIKDVLSAIGSSTHQLNQPLQIIMGKIELLLLDICTDKEVSKEVLEEALKQIKDQVHYAAEINSKINRLSKF